MSVGRGGGGGGGGGGAPRADRSAEGERGGPGRQGGQGAQQRSGTGGPPDGQFKNLATGAMENRKNGGNIQDENISKDSNKPGTLSMANTGQPNSGGSQFFMNVVHNDFLDWFSPGESKHPVFGKAVDQASFDTMVKISQVPTNDDCPITPVKMISVTVA